MPNPNQTQIITVLGQSGSGKSSWIEKHLPKEPRYILWDTLGEYRGDMRVDEPADLYKLVVKNHNQFFGVVFAYSGQDELETFDWTVRLCMAAQNLTFICDEVDQYATPNDIPDSLRVMLKRGRHLNINMIFASRRPAEINRLITAQTRRFILFRTTEPSDIRFLKSVVGPVADDLVNLQKLEYLDWNHGEVSKGKIQWKGGGAHGQRSENLPDRNAGTNQPIVEANKEPPGSPDGRLPGERLPE